jgi:HEPN domain-containing protein
MDEPLRALIRQWLAKAGEDFDLIEHLAKEGSRFPAAVVFHSEQAAEKYLKALLVRYGVDFPKTHDIKELLRLLTPMDAALAAELEAADWLTPFGAAIRYPGDYPQIRPGDDKRAVELAHQVRDKVMRVLQADLSGLT